MAGGFSQCGAVSALTFYKNGLLKCLLLFVVCLIRAELCTFSVNSGPQGTNCLLLEKWELQECERQDLGWQQSLAVGWSYASRAVFCG